MSLRALPADVESTDGETVSFGAGLTLRRARRRARPPRPRAAQPRLAPAHLGRGGDRDRDPRLRRRQRQPRHGGARARAAHRRPATSCALQRGDDDFEGAVVGLGALGVVTRLTLAVEPAFELRQRVFEGLSWEALVEHFDAVTGAGYSVSVFTRLGAAVDAVWVKSRDDTSPSCSTRARRRSSATRSSASTRSTPHRSSASPGPWWDRLPHFRMGFTPSNGEEIQSEYLLPREHAVAAIAALRGLGGPAAPAPAGVRDPHDRRRPAVDEPDVRARHGRAALHVGARPGGRRGRAGAARGRAGAVRAAPALGQGLPQRPGTIRAAPTSSPWSSATTRAARFRNDWLSAALGPRSRPLNRQPPRNVPSSAR